LTDPAPLPGRPVIEKLASRHDVSAFDCGQPHLNHFLHRFALANQQADSSQTYAACRGKHVVGYYSLTVSGVARDEAPPRVGKGLARHLIPVMLLARLAVDLTYQGVGLGRALLKDALQRTAQAADIAGIRALVVHAKDNQTRRWYGQFDFDPSPTDPLHLFLVMKDLKRLTAGSADMNGP
jgi:GNAT superfamily N-acetyltransferase